MSATARSQRSHTSSSRAEGSDYEKEEGGVEEDDRGGEKDGGESAEQMETTKLVRYFHEDDDENGKGVGCGFDNLCVHAEGRNHYALVDPTATTCKSIVCGAAVLVVADPDQFGEEHIFIVTREHALEMKHDPDFQFMYVLMSSMDHTNVDDTAETFA